MIAHLTKTKPMIALSLAGLLALGSIGIASAQTATPNAQAKHGLFGEVTAKDGDSITLKTQKGETVELDVTQQTVVRIPGDADPTFAELAVGSRVAVLASGSGDAQKAERVMVIPARPQYEHRVLTVVDVQGKTVIAEDKDGNQVTITLDHELSSDAKGQMMVFVGPRGADMDKFTAKAEVKISQVMERLQKHAEKLKAEAKAEGRADAKVQKEKALAHVQAVMEANIQRHLDIFAEIIARAPESAKPALMAAMEATINADKRALVALGGKAEQVEQKVQMRRASGVVLNVDAAAKTLTVHLDSGADLSLTVNDATKISVDKKGSTLGDVRPGDRVEVSYNAQTTVAAAINVRVEGAIKGAVQEVNAGAGNFITKLPDGATLTLAMTSETIITVDGKKAATTDLKSGQHVSAIYNIRTMTALKVSADNTSEVAGAVQSVDISAGTVTLRAKDGTIVTLKVTGDTKVQIRGLLFGLLGVSTGMTVKAEYNVTTGEATKIQAQEAHESRVSAIGAITGVDSGAGSVTLKLMTGASLTVRTNADTKVRLDGKDAALTNLKAGDAVHVVYGSDSKTAVEIQARRVALPLRPNSSGKGSGGNTQSGPSAGVSGDGTVHAEQTASAGHSGGSGTKVNIGVKLD